MTGRLGLELAPKDLSEKEIEFVKSAVGDYKRIRSIILFGDLYRLKSPYNSNYSALYFVSEDRDRAVLFIFKIDNINSDIEIDVNLKGIDSQKTYLIKEINKFDGNPHVSSERSTYNGKSISIHLSGKYDSALIELVHQ